MENQIRKTSGEEKFIDKSIHQTHQDSKPVGYGSSIQNSGHGNKTRPQPNLKHTGKEKEKNS